MLELGEHTPVTDLDRLAPSHHAADANPHPFGILVVDDEAYVRDMLAIALRQQGFAVWVAGSGHDAVDLYRLLHRAVDVVLLDVRMPELDGPQTLAALQVFNPLVRCCFMSGELGEYSELQLAALGAAAVFRKPFPLATTGAMIWEIARPAALTSQPRNSTRS